MDDELRAAREGRGLASWQAARQFRRHPSRWSRYESGDDALPLRLRLRVAVAWNMPSLAFGDADVAALLRAARRWDLGPDGPRDPAPAQRVA